MSAVDDQWADDSALRPEDTGVHALKRFSARVVISVARIPGEMTVADFILSKDIQYLILVICADIVQFGEFSRRLFSALPISSRTFSEIPNFSVSSRYVFFCIIFPSFLSFCVLFIICQNRHPIRNCPPDRACTELMSGVKLCGGHVLVIQQFLHIEDGISSSDEGGRRGSSQFMGTVTRRTGS